MKSAKMNFAVNYVKNVAITMALLGWLISCAAPAATAQVVGWAVGEKGTILHSTDGKGQTWKEETLANVGVTLHAVTSFDGKKAWAVGDAPATDKKDPMKKTGPGTLLYYDGTNWAAQGKFLDEKGKPFVPNVNFNAVFALDNSHVWIVGDALTILYYNGKNWQKQPVAIKPPPNLTGVFFTEKAGVSYGWAVGGNGIILHYNGKKWTKAIGCPDLIQKTDFTSISGYGDVEMTHVVAVGKLGIWRSDGATDGDNKWSDKTTQLGNAGQLTVVQAFADNNKWIGQAATEPNVFQWNGKKWTGRPTTAKNQFSVYGISLSPDGKNVWAAGEGGNIAYLENATDPDAKWQVQAPKPAQQLNGIVIRPAPKQQIQLEQSASPDSGVVDVNYVSVTGSGFPKGNINAANVVIELAGECHARAWATTSAVSIVSGSGDSQLVSFQLPAGLDPGQYFIRISDSEEGDANFESSNCSEVNVVQ